MEGRFDARYNTVASCALITVAVRCDGAKPGGEPHGGEKLHAFDEGAVWTGNPMLPEREGLRHGGTVTGANRSSIRRVETLWLQRGVLDLPII